MNKWQKVISKYTNYEKETMKNDKLNMSFRQHRTYIRNDIKEYEYTFEDLVERKNFYRLSSKWFCPKCGSRLEYQDDGAEWKEEWIECEKCDYSRDLEKEDFDLVYGYR